MKHIIIAGAPRSGKTTISRELTYLGYVHYRLDSIKRAVFSMFCPGEKDWNKASKFTAKVIEKLVDDNEQESIRKEYFIFDTPHLYPKDVANFNSMHYTIVFLGYTDVDVDKKVRDILLYDSKTCWTHKLNLLDLYDLVEGNIEFSKEIKEQCQKYDIPYFDISENSEVVLRKAKEYIKDNC